jgi:GNAT superfamily N-acetyltransferase
MVLRGIERGEIAAAVDLIAEGTLSPGVEDARRLDEYWDAVLETRARGGDVVVAVRDGEVLAVCQVLIFRHFQRTAGWCAEVESVYVRSDQRGRGVGRALMAFVEEHARQRGCYRVQLTSRNERGDAHRFYRALGYDQMSQGFKKPLDPSVE